MKVISILHFPEYGGPHNQVLRLASPFRLRGAEYLAVLPEGPGAERLREGGVCVHTIPLGRVRAVKDLKVQVRMATRFPLDVWQLLRLFRREKPDVVQLNGLMNPHSAIAAKMLGIPVVWQLLDTRPPMHIRKIMMRLIRWLADSIMSVGNNVATAHPGADRFGERLVIFYPPVNVDEFRPNLNSERILGAQLNIPAEAPIVGVVGNINPQKGHEYFVDAAALVHESIPEARFVIAGHIYPNHKEYYESLQIRAQKQGLTPGKDIFWLGSRNNIPQVLASLDVLALASVPNSEGTPTAILEAMACGVPVVASDVASVSEVVTDGETGYVVPSMQPEAMAARIRSLLKSPAQREAFGQKARQRVETDFSLDECVDAHMRAFQLAIAHRKGLGNG